MHAAPWAVLVSVDDNIEVHQQTWAVPGEVI